MDEPTTGQVAASDAQASPDATTPAAPQAPEAPTKDTQTEDSTAPIFTDDPATMDLGSKVSQAWVDFQNALAETLVRLPETVAALDITLDPTAGEQGAPVYSVSVDLSEPENVKAYAVSNRTLPREHHLSKKRIGEVVALGWAPPGVVPGSGQRFGLVLPRSAMSRAAAIITRTLREVYGSPHPAFLLYTAVGSDGSALADPPPLGVARSEAADGVPQLNHIAMETLPLDQAVAFTLAAMLQVAPESLPVDPDGDIGIRSGSAMVFVRVREQPRMVEVVSPVLTGVPEHQRLYQRLSELVHRMPIGRLYYAGGTIWAGVGVFGHHFQPTHLMLAVEVMTGLADQLDDLLRSEFGGRRFFGDADEGPDAEPPPNIGQYL